jgi:hypothetical protein
MLPLLATPAAHAITRAIALASPSRSTYESSDA